MNTSRMGGRRRAVEVIATTWKLTAGTKNESHF
jgi:hypothetical protein